MQPELAKKQRPSFSDVALTGGLRGLYRGYGATLLSFGPFSAIFFTLNHVGAGVKHPTVLLCFFSCFFRGGTCCVFILCATRLLVVCPGFAAAYIAFVPPVSFCLLVSVYTLPRLRWLDARLLFYCCFVSAIRQSSEQPAAAARGCGGLFALIFFFCCSSQQPSRGGVCSRGGCRLCGLSDCASRQGETQVRKKHFINL